VVASRLEGIAEAVMHGHNGILVDPGDVATLASAVEEVLTDPRRREALGQAAYETARTCFDITRNVGQLAEAFRNGYATA
jgi:glycosyltransferase involved in cell wall biosynthesis